MTPNTAIGTDGNLRVCYFSLFDNCNVKCNMCDCWTRPRIHLDHGHYEDALHRVLALDPAMIRFTGGEPMLFPTLPQLVKQAKASGCEVSVITNGRVAHSKVAPLRNAGLDLLVVSLDGLAGTHESIRGVPGLWGKVARTIEACVATGTPYAINTVVQRRNHDQLEQLASFLGTEVAAKPAYWHLIPVRGEEELTPSAEQHAAALECATAAVTIAGSAGINCIYDGRLSFDLEQAQGCEVPKQTIYVRADSGDCYGCNMLAYATEPIGNIFESLTVDLWKGPRRRALVGATCAGRESGCSRCDAGSRAMNYWLAQSQKKRIL